MSLAEKIHDFQDMAYFSYSFTIAVKEGSPSYKELEFLSTKL